MTKHTNNAQGTRRGILGVASALLMALVAPIAGLVGCTPGVPHGVTGPTGAGPLAATNTSGLTSFTYSSYNAFGDGSYTVLVERADQDKATISYTIFGLQDLEDIVLTVDASVLDQLDQVYRDQHIAAWDGFDRVDHDVLDGGGFSLNMSFADGKTLSAHGSNEYPKGMSAFDDAIEEILNPYREQIEEQGRLQAIERGTKGDLDLIMVNFSQHGTSGSDQYSFFITPQGQRDRNFEATIKSQGEFFPAGSIKYFAALPNEALWFDRVQELIDRHGVMKWHRWDKTADDYNNAEWFQTDFAYSEEGAISAMGTEHPEGYDAFRAEFLQLMADMVKNAQDNFGLEQYVL